MALLTMIGPREMFDNILEACAKGRKHVNVSILKDATATTRRIGHSTCEGRVARLGAKRRPYELS